MQRPIENAIRVEIVHWKMRKQDWKMLLRKWHICQLIRRQNKQADVNTRNTHTDFLSFSHQHTYRQRRHKYTHTFTLTCARSHRVTHSSGPDIRAPACEIKYEGVNIRNALNITGLLYFCLLLHYAEVNIPLCIFPVPFPDSGRIQCIQCMRSVCAFSIH